MASKTKFNESAQVELLKGVNELADAVATTLGPRGRNVAIAKSNAGAVYERVVIHDGVKVAREVNPKNEFINMGASILREAAQKQLDEVGDGTTAVIVIAQAIINEANKIIASGVNPMSLRADLEKAVVKLTKKLDKLAIPIESLEEKINVATISASDHDLGKLIGETLEKVGTDGVVTIEESKSPETVVEMKEGMNIEKGWYSPYFITDPDRMVSIQENGYVLVTDIPVTNFLDLIPFLPEVFVKKSTTLTVFAPEFGGNALESFIGNKVQGKLQSLLVMAPNFLDYQREILRDIAIYTGARFISKQAGEKLKDIKMEDLGQAEKIISDKEATTILGGYGAKETLEERIKSIRTQINGTDSEFDREKLKERLGALTSQIAVIKVGGQTQIEMNERKERVDDAVHATKAAIEEGIVAGGETIYFDLISELDPNNIAENILVNALEKPFSKLLSNAGVDYGRIIGQLKDGEGYDVTDNKIKDMIKAGIIDPVKVSKCAIRNAVSVAVQIMTTGAVIVPEEEKK